jgi:hypothetical protein
MPTRRTSPRRTATRPSGLYERTTEPTFGDIDDDDPGPGPGWLAGATPWIALLALVLAAGALGFAVIGRAANGSSGGSPGASDSLTACRSDAWSAIPDVNSLPAGWNLGSTDLNANGMTISILGPAPADSSTTQPVVYASVTCYGDSAATALAQNRKAAAAAGSTVTDRSGNDQAYDVDNPSTGSVTTLFRIGGLIGQVADGGTASPTELAAITSAVAAAMGDGTAAGNGNAPPSDSATGSEQPLPSDQGSAGPAPSVVAPELEADLPTSIQGTPLTTTSYSGDQALSATPSSRALAAHLLSLGIKLKDVQIAQAGDDTYSIDITVFGFRAPGLDLAKLKTAVLQAWLGANEPGVKQTTVTLSGKTLIKIDYGTDGPIDYLYAAGDHVIVIDTADPSAATEAAAQIK